MRCKLWMSLVLAAALAGCPGRAGKGSSDPGDEGNGGGDGHVGDHGGGQQVVVSPDTLDAINQTFNRRRATVSRCYADAVYAGKLKKTASGRVSVSVHINTSGKAGPVTVTETTLESKEVEDCIIAMILTWNFPQPEVSTDFAYTYEFLAE